MLHGFLSCSSDSEVAINDPILPGEFVTGKGFFEFSEMESLSIKTYYYIPANTTSNTPIVFVFHGAGRNARDYRDAMISKANQYHFIVVAPAFSITDFPGGDGYNLGNVFVDGDNPLSSTLNPEEAWAFSVIEPLFDFMTQLQNNTTSTYHIFGHSAGGQFAHRFMMFKPQARVSKIVASASGWYTVPNATISFPYGFKNSPLETIDLPQLFQKDITILIGTQDNDPNAGGLRHNVNADAQGLHRLARAHHFFDTAAALAQDNSTPFNWQFFSHEGVGHDYIAASEKGADLIFNP